MIVVIYKMDITEINNYKSSFDNLVTARKLETKNILLYERSYIDFVIYFTKYIHRTSIKMLIL